MNVMMKCGHAANAKVDSTGEPCCAICVGLTPDAEIITGTPDLTGRIAECTYRGSCRERVEKYRDTHYGQFDEQGHSFAPSSTNLPFFEHRPQSKTDSYFCGCLGWD